MNGGKGLMRCDRFGLPRSYRGTSRYFTLTGSWQEGAEAPVAEGLRSSPRGIGATASCEMILVIPVALIARTT